MSSSSTGFFWIYFVLISPGTFLFANPASASLTPTTYYTSLPEIVVPEFDEKSSKRAADVIPQAVQHHNNNNGFVRVSESEYDHIHHTHGHHEHHDTPLTPHLAGNVTGNITTSKRVFLSKTASLDCKVYDIHEESVSWMRQVDDMLRLLSYDKNIYSTDERYELKYESGHDWKRWKLIIAKVEEGDQGMYRCQVTSKPSLVLDVLLNVTEPRTRIVDERGSDVVEKHYNSGSMIELKCIVDQIPASNDPVIWKKQNLKLSFNTSRGGISEKRDASTGVITSRLYVVRASPRDSGVYSCWYGNISSAIVAVHIIAGENSAAMQHDSVADEASQAESSFEVIPIAFLTLFLTIDFYSFTFRTIKTFFALAFTICSLSKIEFR